MSDEPLARAELGLRRVGKDAGNTFAVEIWSIGLGLALSIFLARTLGPEGNGLYALALLLPTTLAQLLNLGVPPANIYFVGRGDVALGTALRATTRLGIIVGVLGLAIVPLVIHYRGEQWFPGVPPSLMLLALAAYPIGLFQAYYATLLTAVKDFRRFNRTLAVMPLVTLTLAAALVLFGGMGVAGAVVAYLAGQFSGALTSRLSLRAHLEPDRTGVDGESWWAYGR
ncbi:MAG TPA: oligosaccharide flippase family protein, partial [Coriobacteriia bacterium]|nr:oligosaccharide flippase family protein [Coriobacteriia bacterium]